MSSLDCSNPPQSIEEEAKQPASSAPEEAASVVASAPMNFKQVPASFRPSGTAKEGHKKSIFCVCWSNNVHLEPKQSSENERNGNKQRNGTGGTSFYPCFATCGGRYVTIYANTKKLTVLQSYRDVDPEESLYVCAFGGRSMGTSAGWGPHVCNKNNSEEGDSSTNNVSGRKRPREESSSSTIPLGSAASNDSLSNLANAEAFDGPQLLCVSGIRGTIKVIDTVRQQLLVQLFGHGAEVYDLKVSPTQDWYLLSASKDESFRLWNLRTFSCLAIFAGHNGHRDSVLSVAWHPQGHRLASAGMDTTIKLWNLDDSLKDSPQQNLRLRRWDAQSGPQGCNEPIRVQFPCFSTSKIHTDYVDCVQFVGDLILSKSTTNTIVLWLPILKSNPINRSVAQHPPGDVVALRTFKQTDCDLWYVRFATDFRGRALTVGNKQGVIRIWDIDQRNEKPISFLKMPSPSTVRMLAFSPDGNTLLACSDNATICRWDVQYKNT